MSHQAMRFVGAARVLQGLCELRVLLQQELSLCHHRIGRALRERPHVREAVGTP
ncbi:hypothetical protein [Methylobacterium sp. E-046]|uniref:hypothetical protein n=1 Tax=Methylobacterium sp. E-046 TaxID=2836576 RepID=UPI001FBAD568|nr:hypothetical protein [Methylobacterium sp. E-046]MCJ2102235.1 hypothetical protein [Methylobacterium sp. E-046]